MAACQTALQACHPALQPLAYLLRLKEPESGEHRRRGRHGFEVAAQLGKAHGWTPAPLALLADGCETQAQTGTS